MGDQKFNNLKSLKLQIKEQLGKQFCEICLKGRKVFFCEQLLYTPKEAKRHYPQGDLYGPLAKGGFKGHPKCEFCGNRFFSETELCRHNSDQRDTCFIRRRENPHIYRYDRDYTDLTEHFSNLHLHCVEAHLAEFQDEFESKMHIYPRENGKKGADEKENLPLTLQISRTGQSKEIGVSCKSGKTH